MKRIIPVLLGLAVALGVFFIRPDDSFSAGMIRITDDQGLFDRALLLEELNSVDFDEPTRLLVHVGESPSSNQECISLDTTCLASLYPDFFDGGAIKDDALAIWVKSNEVLVGFPERGSYSNDKHDTEVAVNSSLTYHYLKGELDEAMIAGAFAIGNDAYFGAENESHVNFARLIQSILAGVLTASLAGLITSAIRQIRNRRRYHSRDDRARAMQIILNRFTRASHAIDLIDLALVPADIISDWKALYIEFTRALAETDFLSSKKYARARYDALIADLDQRSAEIGRVLDEIEAGQIDSTQSDARQIDVAKPMPPTLKRGT